MKETPSKKENHVKFAYEHHQQPYNGASAAGGSEDYRVTTIESGERKNSHHDESNSNDMRMNYASSDDMNQNAASSDHGEKLNSGSEDEGERCLRKFPLS